MIRALKIYYLFIFTILVSCSSEDISQENHDIYIPFPYDSVERVSFKSSKILNNQKNFVLIRSGEFQMGSPPNEPGRSNDETLHTVRITKPFWMGKFEVTVEEWNENLPHSLKYGSPIYNFSADHLEHFCQAENYTAGNYSLTEYEKSFVLEEVLPNQDVPGNWEIKREDKRNYTINAKRFPNLNSIKQELSKLTIKSVGRIGQKRPITHVSYSQATAFCWSKTEHAHKNNLLSKDLLFRLPTEAEWEYASRAGNSGFCGLGNGELLSGVNACLNGSRPEYVLGGGPKPMLFNRNRVMPINNNQPKYKPNKWGLYHMHGNVMEWCHDFYAPYNEKSLNIDPLGPFNGSRRVVRGGSFYRIAHDCRSAKRASYESSYRGSEIGFRLVIGHRLL